MPEFRFNVLTREYVIIATERAKRPMEFAQSVPLRSLPEYDPQCPFCAGNEKMTSAELDRLPCDSGVYPWQTRTVKNKYPALDETAQPIESGCFLRPCINGFGRHEVIVDSPRHDCGITEMQMPDVEKLVETYRRRSIDNAKDPRVKHIIIFKNNGVAAGSSLIHPHSQLIAAPIVSSQIYARIDTTRNYRDETGRCLMCDMLKDEIQLGQRIIYQNAHFVSFLPYAALSSFHTWIFPLQHNAHFDRLTDAQIPALADILYYVIKAQARLLNYPDYNMVIRSAPLNLPNGDYHWYISIIPRLSKTAGFEIGSNIYINSSLPEQNALELRNVIDVLKNKI